LAENNSSSFESIVGLAAGTGAGIYAYKNQNTSNLFKPSLDPRANILNKIQSINIDNTINQSVRRFQMEHVSTKLAKWHEEIATYNKLGRNQIVGNINQVRVLLQEHAVGNSKYGPVYSSTSPVTNLPGKRLAQLTDKGLHRANQSLVTSEWAAAVKATFPNPLEARIAHGSNAFDAIKMTVSNNPSILMQRAFYTFEKNMDLLLRQGVTEDLGLLSVNKMVSNAPLIAVGAPYTLGDSRLKSTVTSIEKALGTKFDITRRGKANQGELSFFLPGRNKALFTLPESFGAVAGDVPGLIRTGTGLHNVYAPGLFGIVKDGELSPDYLDFSEMKSKRILDAVLEQNLSTDTPGLGRKIKAIEEEAFKLASYMEPNINGDDFSLETMFKSNQLTLLDEQGSPVTGDVRRKLAKQLYSSGVTPSGADSKFNLFPEEELYGTFASQQDYARKPWQFIRQYRPTEEALALNRASEFAAEEFNFLDSPLAQKTNTLGARMKTLYLSEKQLTDLSDLNVTIGDGELLIDSQMKSNLQVSRIKRVNILELDTHIANLMKRGGVTLDNIPDQIAVPNISVSGTLGRNAEGRIVATERPSSIVGISPNLSKGLDDTTQASLDLLVKETIDMSDSEKVFGSLKGMARFTSDPTLRKKISKVTGIPLSELNDVSAFARADDLKDNSRKLQAALSNFVLNGKRSTGTDIDLTSIYDDLKTLKPSEGQTFESAVDNYLSSKSRELGFSTSLSLEGKSGGFGVSQLYFGGAKDLTGAGNIGTIEPRIFTLLDASNPGKLGQELNSEFLERMIKWNPGKVTMQEEIMKSINSLQGGVAPTSDSFVLGLDELKDKAKTGDLFRRGGFVATGTDKMPHVYIPGYEQVPELHPRMVDTGAVVDTSQPGKIYRGILSDIKAMNSTSGILSEEQFMENMSGKGGHLSQLLREGAIAGKGAGAITRGEVPGSRGLTVLSNIDSKNQGAFNQFLSKISEKYRDRVVGISDKYAGQMFEEMEKLYGIDAVSGMKQRFNSGELIAGMGMRHPTIGTYSMQPVLFKKEATDEAVALISERMKDVTFSSPAGSITKSIQTGILPGLAADKDADTVMAMLLSPQMEEKMRNQLMNVESVLNSQLDSYRDHSIRMQLLKPKAAKGADIGVSLADRRAAESTKLALTSEEVGMLSTNLTKSRVAVMSSNLPESRKLTSLSLLEWLEQQPISGKHVAVKDAMSGIFETQIEALKTGSQGNAPLLQAAIEDMTQNVSPELKPLFYEGLTSSEGKISGFNIQQSTNDIANSVREMRALPEGSQLSIVNRFATPSRSGAYSLEQIPNILSANSIRKTEGFAESSRNLMATINSELGSAINKVRPFIKPIAIGAAVAGAAMAILSPIPSNMPAPKDRSFKTDNMEASPSKQVMGQPTVSPQMQPVVTDMADSSYENRKGIRTSIRANQITSEQRKELTQRLNSRYPGSHLNLNIQDDRRTLNPHAISDML
jgi:hypothetical protein